MFRIGQKVVCVDVTENNGPWWCVWGEVKPQLGEVYTVRAIVDCGIYGIGLHLAEIVNRPGFYLDGLCEQVFDYWRFRPVVERKTETGMAILREILERESHQDRVPVRQ